MHTLIELDRELFLYLNGHHAEWLDQPFYILTNTLTWIPLYAMLLYFTIQQHFKQSWIFLLGIVITVTLADQTTSAIMKPYFQRFRPTHEPEIKHLVHTVNNYFGGRYGFASSHAANTFGVATFIFLLLRKTKKWMGLIFVWAVFVTYSRIYLGVHYPADVVVGGIIGASFGWLSLLLCYQVREIIYPASPPSGLH